MSHTAARPGLPAFAADVRSGLTRAPKQLPPKYFYDALGSSLFEAICRLPWYPLTRAETRLLQTHAEAILDATRAATLVELGCGNGDKLEILAATFTRVGAMPHAVLIDVSAQALEQTAERVRALGLRATALQKSFEEGLAAFGVQPREGAVLVLFLGSNIGNFAPQDADALLRAIRTVLRPGDHLLLGADLRRGEADLVRAYDDPLGVTAAFNLNLLVRMNRELGANFDLAAFEHRAVWNARESRVEMHLVSRRPQTVRIAAADVEVRFEAGETIWTESSYKYEPDAVTRLGQAAGFAAAGQWIEPDARFSLTLFAAV